MSNTSLALTDFYYDYSKKAKQYIIIYFKDILTIEKNNDIIW